MSEMYQYAEFTKEMKKTHTLLFPNMCDIQFRLLENVFRYYGYKVERLTNTDKNVLEEGLKYIHNDMCYPAILTLGQMISALKSGKYDLEHTGLMMTQTGGGCRASNYIYLLRKALKNAGMEQVPVVSVNFAGLAQSKGFKMTIPMLFKGLASITYGDLIMVMANQTRPYEINKGETDRLVDYWIDYMSPLVSKGKAISARKMRPYMEQIAESFGKIPTRRTPKVKVGIVGEIYVKYSALANNDLEKFLHSQDCEVMLPPLMGFMMYSIGNPVNDYELYGGKKIGYVISRLVFKYLTKFEKNIIDCVKGVKGYTAPASYEELKEMSKGVIGYGCKMGEGWILTAEMIELCKSGYENIICAQPFGCLPNHIIGKGMTRPILEKYPNANIVAIDYDASATKVNQENRIKLMLSVARERLSETKEDEAVTEKENFTSSDKTKSEEAVLV